MEFEQGRITINMTAVKSMGIDPSSFKVVASDGGMTIEGQCTRCPNKRKIVDISPNGQIEVLNCVDDKGKKEDCLQ